MGIDWTLRGTFAKDGNKVGPRIMILSVTIQTLAPKAPPCCVVGADAVVCLYIKTGEEHDFPRISRFSPAIQMDVIP